MRGCFKVNTDFHESITGVHVFIQVKTEWVADMVAVNDDRGGEFCYEPEEALAVAKAILMALEFGCHIDSFEIKERCAK